MNIDLSAHPYFERFYDPVAGTLSYVLTRQVAPIQQTFYYTNPSISADESLLWFQTAFPPNPVAMAGVCSLDPSNPFIRQFPQDGGCDSSPLVSPGGNEVYLAINGGIYLLDLDGGIRKVAEVPGDYIAGRRLWRTATHLSLSADGRHILLDGHVGDIWFVATASLETGEFQIIQEFQSNHNHAQFSPLDPNLFLIAHDHYRHPSSGRFMHHLIRTQLMTVDKSRYECINPQFQCAPHRGACHEWFIADGRIAYIEFDSGVWIYDDQAKTHGHVWRQPLCHAHSDASGRYFCADQSPYYWNTKPCEVLFLDTVTGKVTAIDSGMPGPGACRGLYHIDPHPQFSPKGTWVNYTTTRLGAVNVALSPVANMCLR